MTPRSPPKPRRLATKRIPDLLDTVPVRTCVGCRSAVPQDTLVRCVLSADGEAVISRTAAGRGAWVCSIECIDVARRKRAFERAWRRPVRAGALDELKKTFESNLKMTKKWSAAGHQSDEATPMKG